MQELNSQIGEIEQVGGGLIDLWLRPDAPGVGYRFGQFLVVRSNDLQGYFAIADFDALRGYRLLVKPQPGLAALLAASAAGVRVHSSAAQGNGFDTTVVKPWFVVVGSGLAAVLGWLRAMTAAGESPTLLYGVYSAHDCPLQAELAMLVSLGAHVLLCESGAVIDPRAAHSALPRDACRVQDALAKRLANAAFSAGHLQPVVAVGPAEMLAELAQMPSIRVLTNL